VCNPLLSFDDDLNNNIAYAWTLPTHLTFERKMADIKSAMDEAAMLPPSEYARSQIKYFTTKIREVVRVSNRFEKFIFTKEFTDLFLG
jgi:hypothetical protein